MYLHLGQNVLVRDRDILGIFDLDNVTYQSRAAAFLNVAQKEGRVVSCTEDLPKSVVLCGETLYLSQLSSATLLKRVENGDLE